MIGRPSLYTEELGLTILGRMTEGETLTEICAEPGMPGRATVYRWGEANQDFRDALARARELQAHAIAEGGFMRGRDARDPQLDRLAFDAARWFAGRMAPRIYGDKITQEHVGAGGGPVITATITTDDPVEAARVYQRLMGGE